jgi:hypothetical protein
VGIIGIRGNNIFSPRNLPFKIMASITFFINLLMTNRVSLHNRSRFKLRSKITGDLTFSCKLCGVYGGLPGKSNEFKNFIILFIYQLLFSYLVILILFIILFLIFFMNYYRTISICILYYILCLLDDNNTVKLVNLTTLHTISYAIMFPKRTNLCNRVLP